MREWPKSTHAKRVFRTSGHESVPGRPPRRRLPRPTTAPPQEIPRRHARHQTLAADVPRNRLPTAVDQMPPADLSRDRLPTAAPGFPLTLTPARGSRPGGRCVYRVLQGAPQRAPPPRRSPRSPRPQARPAAQPPPRLPCPSKAHPSAQPPRRSPRSALPQSSPKRGQPPLPAAAVGSPLKLTQAPGSRPEPRRPPRRLRRHQGCDHLKFRLPMRGKEGEGDPAGERALHLAAPPHARGEGAPPMPLAGASWTPSPRARGRRRPRPLGLTRYSPSPTRAGKASARWSWARLICPLPHARGEGACGGRAGVGLCAPPPRARGRRPSAEVWRPVISPSPTRARKAGHRLPTDF